MIRKRACSGPPLGCECTATGGVMVVAQDDQALRLPSMMEKQLSPRMISDTATELCRCGGCAEPGGREFIAAVSVGRMLRVASCLLSVSIQSDRASVASRTD